jgi:hypothetical protein
MSQGANALPKSDQLNIEAFSKLFTHTANSYKYLFFLALLNILKQRKFDHTPIALQDLMVEMLVIAWQAYHPHRLSFGNKDMIAGRFDVFDEVGRNLSGEELRKAIASKMLSTTKELKKFAPYRLIRPFFEMELKGVKSGETNQNIAALSCDRFQDKKPLYSINDQDETILLHPEWIEYLKTNYDAICQWGFAAWLEYMQKCNSSIDNLSKKLAFV